jgi:hypothetical protein
MYVADIAYFTHGVKDLSPEGFQVCVALHTIMQDIIS